MKRGQGTLSLKKLVEFLPTLLLWLGLIAVLAMVLVIFMVRSEKVEEKDFARIIGEVDEYEKSEYQGPESIRVPINSASALSVISWPAGKGPRACRGFMCICLYFKEGVNVIEKCEIFEKISATCAIDMCGPLCLTEIKELDIKPDATKITVTRECNEITIT